MNKILLVDDDLELTQLLTEILTLEGFEVTVAEDGEEGLLRLAEQAFDLVLLDVMMPGMDGPAVLVKLRELIDIKQTPVAFMTAKVQPQEVEHYRQLGALDVIVKPFDAMKLAGQVRAIWSSVHG